MSSLLLAAPPVPGDSHPLLCRAWGAAAEDAAPEVQRAGSLRGSLPCLHPWSMCTRSCGLQSQRQLRVPLAITLPLGHRLHKLARLLRLLQPHGPAVLGMPLVPSSALSSLWRGAGSRGRCLQSFCAVPSMVQPVAQQLLFHSTWHCKSILNQKSEEIPSTSDG